MSTFILKKESLEKICNSGQLLSKVNFGKSYYYDDLYNWFSKLYLLNIQSYNERYPDDKVSDDEIDIFYTLDKKNNSKINNEYQLLKTLQCLRYNIDFDVKDFDKPGLYDYQIALENLDSMINRIKDYIISNIDDYNNAIWG